MWSSTLISLIDPALRLGLCKPKLHLMHGLNLVPWGHVICMMLMCLIGILCGWAPCLYPGE